MGERWCVYLLQDAAGNLLHGGITCNLANRLRKERRSITLAYAAEASDLVPAIAMDRELRFLSAGEKQELVKNWDRSIMKRLLY